MADGIAIIGIGCRFPGATCLEEYWDILSKGENHVVDIPPERWNMDAFFDSDVNAVGKSYATKAGLLKNFDHFDNKLFKINETEAAQMDPQQRQVLECTYMALEDAGITRQQIAGQKVGVYIGSMTVDYGDLISNKSPDVTNHTVTGQASSIISNRVSYVYNLTGPSMTIDTACSSSIVAIHQAGLALRAGDCSIAICGGVNLLIHPAYFIKLSKAQMLSPTGQCHAFSANADGYTRGEGCGIVIVKLLSQALHDGDNIWGTIVTGLNQDGRQVTPITAPSGKQQQELLKDIYTRHGIDPTQVDYIEAHGTGTKRGDPVEATALGTFFEKYPRQRHIGSVKTNIGHLEAAAGVAGLIKVLLMMKHNTIVPSLHFDKPSEAIDFDRFNFVVPTENTDWKRHKKVACINSFGFGGSNSHAVLKSFTMETSVNRDISLPVCFSGSNEKTLNKSMTQFIESGNSSIFNDVAYTSCIAREHFAFRKAFFANSHSTLKSEIQEELQNKNKLSPQEKGNIVFVFCGMGTAWEGMCNDLILNSDQFSKMILEIDKSLSRFVDWSLLKRFQECDDVKDPQFGPIAIFACQVSLANLWESWGVKPAAVVGQSVGEVAAAHIAGILSLDEAVRVIYHRTRILAETTGGKMMLVRNVDTAQVKAACGKYQGQVDVALYYSPVSCTISGDERSILSVKEDLGHISDSNTLFHELPVTNAFHSPHMDSARVQLDEILSNINTSKMTSTFVSTVDPDMDEAAVGSNIYWGSNVRSPVRFFDAIKKSTQTSKMNIFVEIGPRPVLKSHLRDMFKDSTLSVTSIPSLHQDASYSDILQSLLVLYGYGVSVKWDTFFPDKMHTTSYPSYVFNSKALLLVSESKQQMLKGRKESQGDHLFLKGSIESGSASLIIDPQRFKSVFEHKVKGTIIVPGAVYAEAALALARMIDMYHRCAISVSVSFRSPVNLKSGTVTNLDIKQSHNEADTSVLSRFVLKKGSTVHAEAMIRQTPVDYAPERVDLGPIKERCKHIITGKEVYQHLENGGFSYGEMMSIISGSQTAEKESITVLEVGSQLQTEVQHTILHPAVLDGMLQTPATVTHVIKDMLPFSLEHLVVKRKTERKMLVHLKVLYESVWYVCYTLSLLTTEGYVIAHIGKFTLKAMGTDTFDVRSVAYTIGSEEVEPDDEAVSDTIANLVMFSDEKSMSRTTIFPWTVHDISTLHDNSSVPDLLESSGILVMFQAKPGVVDNGLKVETELEEKIMPLRSLILYMSQQAIKSPLVIVTMATALDYQSPDRRSHALACIHEGIRAFIRCVRREFPRLKVTSLDLNIGNMDQYDANIIMSEISQVLNVKGHAEFESLHGSIYGQKFQKEPNSTPDFRLERKMASLDTVLYSTSDGEISQPFFTISRNMPERGKDDILFTAQSVAVHSKFLSEQVLQSLDKGGHMGSSKGSPVVTFESTGFPHSNSRRKMYMACYPHQVRYQCYAPVKFTLNVRYLCNFQTGYLLKLYCLWRLCGECNTKDVIILYTQQTRKYAEVMEIILLSKQTRKLSLLTPEEIPSHQGHHVVISTTQITEELAQQIVLEWGCIEKLISFEKLISLKVTNLLQSVKPRLKIALVRTQEALAFNQMDEHIPKLYTWIKKNTQNVRKIGFCFRDCKDIPLKHQVAPINIAEILETWEFNIQENNGVTTTQLKIPEILLFDRRGMYLVVGGMTGLGWECVLYLASKGAGCITIISRRKPDPTKQDEMKHVSKIYGCTVTSEQADVQDIKAIGSALKKLGTRFPAYTLKGVFFGAAVLKDGILLEMTRDKFKIASSPKVAGSWNLHLLTEHLQLDYFVLFSSVVSVFGNAGQTNYGAGNGFMDALAHVRRQNCQSGQTVNWGPLNMGMLQERHIKQMESFGYILIHKRSIPDCLTHVLMMNRPQIIMCGLQLVKFGQNLHRETNVDLESRFKSVLSPFKAAMSSASPSNAESFDVHELKKMSEENALAKLVKYVKAVVIDVAMLDESSVDVEQGTRDQGVDSMNFMQITGKIMDDTHVQLSATKLNVENASVTQISRYIYDEWMIKGNCDLKHEQPLQIEYSSESDTILIPGEQFVFDNYLRDPNHISHLMIVELELPDVSEPTSLKKILQENVRRHPMCRSTFHVVNEEVRKSTLGPDDDIDFRIGFMTNRSDVTHLAEERFYLDRQGPIRFVFVKGNPPHLIIVFHRIAFDYQGITIMINDFMNIGQAFSRGQSLSDVQSDPDVPMGLEIRTILQPRYQHIKQFWMKTLDTVPHISFADRTVSSTPQMDSISVQRIVPTDLYQKLNSFSDKEGLSRFKCLVGLVQLLWSSRANGQKFAMTTYVDQRIFSPKLTTSVGRGVNFTPLSCEVRDVDRLTVVTFLRENGTRLEECIENGIFPFGDLKLFLPKDDYDNVMTSFVTFGSDEMRNMGKGNDMRGDFGATVRVKALFGPNTELYFDILNRRISQTIAIVLYARKDCFTEKRTHMILNAFFGLLGDTLANPQMTIRTIQTKPYITQLQNKKTRF
ncbi:hybrid PKS-NRPS synthetase pytA-like [Haliotis rufescens]|uniref:hybrid PKS-NRPS synthetase pytA-like n=1 Tax=Haliotis rufescens TaxID=6454 RepID=UPI00201F7867|nr:hybrid PKS-NRPS synthetase pytA-like [Haliotis rufescens]